MSKIAEQKALEAYQDVTLEECHGDTKMMHYCNDDNPSLREGYVKGYGQALQDFMEKAEKFFKNELYVSVSDQICSMNEFKTMKDFVNYFKNYIQETN